MPPPPDPPRGNDLAQTLSSARALVGEWLEEGVETYEKESAAEAAAPASAGAEAQRPEHRAPERAVAPEHPSSLLDPGATVAPGASLEQVRATIGDCTRCRLHEARTQIVFGDGNPEADLLFIGEGPGEQEDQKGVPFVGRAGELLTQMIEKGLEIPRSAVYICNIVKCRPPGNRTPQPDEVQTCRAYLDAQIEAIAPKVIVSLGKPATSLLVGRDVPITKVRGTWFEYRGTALMPTFHPAFVLRQYTAENRRLVWEDLKGALARAESLGAVFPVL